MSPQIGSFSRDRVLAANNCPGAEVRSSAYSTVSRALLRGWKKKLRPGAACGDPAELVAEQVSALSGSATASLGPASNRTTGALGLATGAACTHGALRFRLAGGLRFLLHNPCHCFLSFSFPV
jgi:hypothetical protein